MKKNMLARSVLALGLLAAPLAAPAQVQPPADPVGAA